MSTLGERLRSARKRKGLSQVDVFEAVGISNKSLSRYEKDDGAPSPDALKRLSRLYDVSSEYLLGLTPDMGRCSDGSSDTENLIGMTDNRTSAERLLSFIACAPTMFHAVENIAQKLANDGFERLNEWDSWTLSRGGKYFVTRNDSSIIAFKIGAGDPQGFSIYAAHSDSPTFKLKPSFEMAGEHYVRVNAERYGGMIRHTWVDRPLSVAGRLMISTSSGLKSVLVNLGDTLMIPSVAIHMQRDDNLTLDPKTDLLPLYGSETAKGKLMQRAAEAAGVKLKDVASADLYLYNKANGVIWGDGGEYVSAPKLDDLQCAYAGLQGFLAGGNGDRVSVLSIFDNEEVGSSTKQGANSDFLTTTIERISEGIGKPMAQMLPQSFAISADNAHAVHPNHPEFADPLNRPFMNGGIVVKHSARQSYATDAVSEAIFKKICASVDVPTQSFANRSDMPGGSTLGNISATRLSVNTVDVGLAQLAMHSSFETAGSMDTLYLERAAAEFFRTKIERTADGGYKLSVGE